MNMAMLQTLAVSLGDKALVMTPLLVALSDLASTAGKSDMLLEGQSNLLHHREIASNAFELMEFLRRGEPLSSIFQSHKDELNVLIGKENLYRELENSSVIFSKYSIGGRDSGTLGIVGPTNIDYARLIPSLKYLTTIVGKLLTDAVEE
jgi:heat-inducible transcriptional repressor